LAGETRANLAGSSFHVAFDLQNSPFTLMLLNLERLEKFVFDLLGVFAPWRLI
jgi:hypothetical protein